MVIVVWCVMIGMILDAILVCMSMGLFNDTLGVFYDMANTEIYTE